MAGSAFSTPRAVQNLNLTHKPRAIEALGEFLNETSERKDANMIIGYARVSSDGQSLVLPSSATGSRRTLTRVL